MRKILLIGKTGQIGSNLAQNLDCQTIGREELDLSQPATIFQKLQNYKPEIIINAAAYTDVDKAEDEKDLCNKINHLAVAEIARFCAETKATLVHYSTDYVFDGSGDKEFTEDNKASLKPLNYYGITKLAAENAIMKSGCKHLILRTSWVYNHSGKNFVRTMLKLAAEKDELKIVADQIGSPTYALDIAQTTIRMLENIKPGIYHIVPHEKISWQQFANMIIKDKKIIPITSAEYPTKAKRPLNSRLSAAKLQKEYGIDLPPIAESLALCLKKIRDGK